MCTCLKPLAGWLLLIPSGFLFPTFPIWLVSREADLYRMIKISWPSGLQLGPDKGSSSRRQREHPEWIWLWIPSFILYSGGLLGPALCLAGDLSSHEAFFSMRASLLPHEHPLPASPKSLLIQLSTLAPSKGWETLLLLAQSAALNLVVSFHLTHLFVNYLFIKFPKYPLFIVSSLSCLTLPSAGTPW